jgi:tetratricopeptide (TPR) repeat protein
LDDATAVEMKLLELFANDKDDQREQADCYHRLGSLQLQMQHFADARRYYQLALALFYEIHGRDSFHREMGKLLVGLGGICVHQGDPERALPLLAQAEEHYRQHGRRVTDPVIMDSTITSDIDDIDDDIDIDDIDGPHPEISVVLGNQALIHRMMGQHQVAIEKYKEMLVFLDRYETHNEEKKHEVQLQIADCLFAVNQLGPALDHFQILLDNLKSPSRRRGDDEETAQEGVLRYHIGVIHSKQVRTYVLLVVRTASESDIVTFPPTHFSFTLEWFCSYLLTTTTTTTDSRVAWKMP